jgi:hypothetical protein
MATIGSVSLALLSGCVALQKGQSEDDDLPFLPPPTLEKPLPPVPQPTLSQIPGYEEAAPQLAAAEGAEIEPTPVPRAPLAEDCEAVAGSSFSECPMD